jgi:O-antigen/teichoic acid export membrane protein
MKNKIIAFLRWSEGYTKTDMVYLVKNSFWINTNTIIVTALSFGLSIFFAKFLTKETYGNYQFILSLSAIISALTLTGINTAVTQAVARGFEGVFQKSVWLQIKYAIIPLFFGILISIYYSITGNKIVSEAILIVAILIPLTNTLNTWAAFLSGKKDFESLFKYNQLINISYYLGMMVVVFLIPKTLPLVFFNLSITTLANLLVYKLVIKKYQPNTKSEENALSFGKKFSLSNILPMIALNIDNIIIFHFLGASNLAIYTFASNIPERLGGLLRPISILALPKFSEKQPAEVVSAIKDKIKKLLLLGVIGWVLYFFISPFVFKLFFPQYLESIFLSQIFALSIVVSTIAGLIFTGLSAIRSEGIFKFNIVNPIFNIVIIFVSVYFFGLWGAVISKILGNIFQTFISWHYLKD